MSRRFHLLLTLALLALAVPGASAKSAPAPAATNWAELQARLHRSVASSLAPGAAWGVLVVSADSGKPWFATNASRLFVPASNAKLFTVALALDRFGPDHRFNTDVALSAPAGDDGVSPGTLWIRAGGVPFTGPRCFAPVAAFLARKGVRRVQGGLVLDTSWFENAPFGSGWDWDDLQEPYAAPVGPFVWNDNVLLVEARAGVRPGDPVAFSVTPHAGLLPIDSHAVTGTTNATGRLRFRRLPGEAVMHVHGVLPPGGTVTERYAVPDARQAFGLGVREALRAENRPVDGPIRLDRGVDPVPAEWETLPGPTLGSLVPDCLKPSDNLLAQVFLLQVGADVRRHPRPGESPAGADDEARGAAAMGAFLRSAGIGAGEAFLEEGSGLSRKNLVSPDATVRLLRHVQRQPWGRVYLDALPVAGVDGTLAGRFTAGAARGNVRAKTGTLRHVHALAGHLRTAGGQALVFAAYANGFQSDTPGASARAEIDRLVELLAAFEGRGPE